MIQLQKEHSFGYINNLFSVIKADYYNNNRINTNHFNRKQLYRSPIKFTYDRIISFENEDEYRYEFNVSGYSELPDGIEKKSNINSNISKPLQTIRHQLTNLNMIIDEIKSNNLQSGMKKFFMIWIYGWF